MIQHRDEDPGLTLGIHCYYFPYLGCDGDYLSMICILSHRSTVYWSIAMFFS